MTEREREREREREDGTALTYDMLRISKNALRPGVCKPPPHLHSVQGTELVALITHPEAPLQT